MLLDAGADPNDNQAFYNRQFRPDDSHLPPAARARRRAGRTDRPWRDRLGVGVPVPGRRWSASTCGPPPQHGFTERVRLLLAHGVDPNTRGYHPILGDQTAYEIAVRNGHREAAGLLAAAGGRSDRIGRAGPAARRRRWPATPRACHGGGSTRRPWWPVAPTRLRLAGEQHGVEAVGQLLDLGYGVDAAGPGRTDRAARGRAARATWSSATGCSTGAPTRASGIGTSSGTPADWAAHAGHPELAARLAHGGVE